MGDPATNTPASEKPARKADNAEEVKSSKNAVVPDNIEADGVGNGEAATGSDGQGVQEDGAIESEANGVTTITSPKVDLFDNEDIRYER